MKRPIVESNLEIYAEKTGQHAFLGCFNNSFFNRWNVCFGDYTAHNGIDKLEPFSPGHRFQLNPAVPKLAVATGLFFMFALDTDFLLNGFPVRNFGRIQHYFDIEFSFELFTGGFDMNLPPAR